MEINNVEKPLMDIVTIGGGKVEIFDGERKYLSTGNLDYNRISDLDMVTYETKPSRASQNVQINDVLFAKMKDTKKTLIINSDNEDIIVSSGFYVLRPQSTLNSRYLYHFLNSEGFLRKKNLECKGATQKALNDSGLRKINIFLPSLEVQQKIANTLDKAQELIDKRKEQIKDLDDLTQSVFYDMFGELLRNSKEWKSLAGCLISIENGKSFVCENFSRKGTYPAILKLSAVTYGYFQEDENKALIKSEDFVASVEVKSGDLLLTRKNTPELVGMAAYIEQTKPNLMMPDLIFRLNPTQHLNKIYLWKLINCDFFRGEIRALATGSAKSMSNISKQRLMDLKIPLPPLDLQNQFAEIVKNIEKQKALLKTSLKELETNFDSLMQRAFKGELF